MKNRGALEEVLDAILPPFCPRCAPSLCFFIFKYAGLNTLYRGFIHIYRHLIHFFRIYVKRGEATNLVAVMSVFIAVKEARGEANSVLFTEVRYISFVFARIRRHINYMQGDCI